jgi:hypothetical protein
MIDRESRDGHSGDGGRSARQDLEPSPAAGTPDPEWLDRLATAVASDAEVVVVLKGGRVVEQVWP